MCRPDSAFSLVCIEKLDAVRYSNALRETRDGTRDGATAQLNAFGSASEQANKLIMTPTLLMDEFGVIVGCYLPDILLPDVQVSHLSPAHDCH